jgi:raffinose/stachyose/melibiose transport system substrate-binding protein
MELRGIIPPTHRDKVEGELAMVPANGARALTILAAGALLLAACSPTANGTAAPSVNPSGGVTDQPVTLEWYSALNENEPYVAAYKKIIASYEALHPNITIHVTWMGRSLSTKIRPLLQSGTKPDIIEDDLQIMYAGLRNGLVADLTPYLNQPGYNTTTTWKDMWSAGSLELLSTPGQLTTLPFWVNATQVFYDERLFTKYNLSVPTSWDQLMSMCATLKAQGVPCFGQEGGFADYNMFWLSELTDRLIGPDALINAASDKTGQTWMQPEYLDAAQKEASLKANGYFPQGFEGSQYPAAQIAWVNGKTAFYLLSDWLPSELVDKAPPGFVFRSFPFPTVDGKGSTTDIEMYQWGFSLFKDAPHPNEAVDFMKYFTSPDVFKPLQTDYAFVSGIKTDFTPKDNADSQANIRAATAVHGYAGGLVAQAPDYLSNVLEPLNDKLIFNEITPEQFIQEVSQKTADYWKSH